MTDVKINCRSSTKKQKQKLRRFEGGSMNKELGSSGANKSQGMVIMAAIPAGRYRRTCVEIWRVDGDDIATEMAPIHRLGVRDL
jgi:hypothetical protein